MGNLRESQGCNEDDDDVMKKNDVKDWNIVGTHNRKLPSRFLQFTCDLYSEQVCAH